MPFLFGLNPDFSLELMDSLQKNLCVRQSAFKQNNLNYEGQLYFEACDENLQRKITFVLSKCNVKVSEVETNIEKRSDLSTYKLCTSFSESERILVLSKWYDLTVFKDGDEWVIRRSNKHNEEKGQLSIETLDFISYCLLLPFEFPQVTGLTIGHSCIYKIRMIESVFTHLRYLSVKHFAWNQIKSYRFLDKLLPTKSTGIPTLTHIHIPSIFANDELLEQSKLQSVTVGRLQIITSMISSVQPSQPKVMWKDLNKLQLGLPFHRDPYNCLNSTLSMMLSNSPNLEILIIDFIDSEERDALVETIMNCIKHLPQLHILGLYNISGRFQQLSYLKDPSPLTESMCTNLQKIPTHVTTLRLDSEDIVLDKQFHRWDKALRSLIHIQNIVVIYHDRYRVNSAVKVLNKALPSAVVTVTKERFLPWENIEYTNKKSSSKTCLIL